MLISRIFSESNLIALTLKYGAKIKSSIVLASGFKTNLYYMMIFVDDWPKVTLWKVVMQRSLFSCISLYLRN